MTRNALEGAEDAGHPCCTRDKQQYVVITYCNNRLGVRIISLMKTENPYPLHTPEEVAHELAQKARRLRLYRNWKQSTLSERSGVALASLRRFERTGEVSLKHLLRLCFALGRLDDFHSVLLQAGAGSIRELEARTAAPGPERGTQ